jgi:hypothetical protein
MTTIELPATLTAHAGYRTLNGVREPCVALHFGGFEVAAWPVTELAHYEMQEDGTVLEAFVADKLAALFAPTVVLSGCACGPQQ